MAESFKPYSLAGLAIDPIHVGTGGARLGRVDLSIVRDPVTRVPKIPGSSLAGVYRAYAAMAKGKYPGCAGLGVPQANGSGGHCGQGDCPICTVFGFARGPLGGFAGLAAFSDAHVLLFPVATREGPLWLTSPGAVRLIEQEIGDTTAENVVYRHGASQKPLNLGWLMLQVKGLGSWAQVKEAIRAIGVPNYILERMGIVPDKLFTHVVNSNLEVRTSVSIDPRTGAAEERALFTYEALPRATVLHWDVTCRNPGHFRIGGSGLSVVTTPEDVHGVVEVAHAYLEHLGIGGMGTRGMGRLRVLGGSNGAAQASATASAAGRA